MNKERRKRIEEAIKALEEIAPKLADAISIVETAAEEEREFYDNMPEGLQGGDKGIKASETASALEEVKEAFEDIDMADLISKLSEAKE